ncbi:MAG TPA: hypothetical protein ENK57_16580 [Polyangiaceae bacterium]|nr:hypothetical protein [Polyangiaceae bacterium]
MCTSKLRVGLAVVTMVALGCEDPPTPPMPSGSARPAASSAGAAAEPPAPPPPRTLEAPSAEQIAALDVRGACLRICETQVRCSVKAEVAEDERLLAERQKGCVASCKRTTPPKEVQEEYLARARRCLASKDCPAFNSCAFATSP